MCPKPLLSFLAALVFLTCVSVHSTARAEAAHHNSAGKGSTSKSPASTSSGAQAKTNSATKKTSGKRGKRRRRDRGQKSPTTDRIREIQAILVRAGTYSGEPNGKWDAASIAAMKQFQSANGLNPTGKLDARSLQKLGLGSDVAGAGAPRSPARRSASSVAPPP